MDSKFLGINSLISGWITAYLLALLCLYFIRRTSFFDSLVHRLKQASSSNFIKRNSDLLAAFSVVLSLGLSLSVLMSFQPDQDSLISAFIIKVAGESVWTRYSFLFDDLLISVGVLLIILLIPTINKFFSKIYQKIDYYRETRFRVIKYQNLEIFTPNRMVGLLVMIAKYFRFSIISMIGLFFMTLVFSLYPQTEGFARTVLYNMNEVLLTFWKNLINFIPDLFALVVIAFFTRFALRLLRFFYEGMQQGKIRFSSIHPEVVEPTYQILRFLVIAFALVAAFPFIPGSSSPMFRGLSIFVGFLISLGSTSLITNIISGIVLTYSRGLKIGDRVKIGETIGDVVDRTLLITRVRTIKNVVITIPNVVVMQNEIINFSSEARDAGLILHTSVTIGYDEPWRNVQKLLVTAARETVDIMEYPEPYVLKTSLDNHYITYELNAYTDRPLLMEDIYSELHQNILDKFNQAEVEILSPTYFAFRDGQSTTINQVEITGNGSKPSKENHTTSYRSYREKTQPLGSR
jgi:small-conductance mechanosensitive channel